MHVVLDILGEARKTQIGTVVDFGLHPKDEPLSPGHVFTAVWRPRERNFRVYCQMQDDTSRNPTPDNCRGVVAWAYKDSGFTQEESMQAIQAYLVKAALEKAV